MFIRTKSFNEYINSDDIVRLYRGVPTVKGVERVLATMRDGPAVELGAHSVDEAAASMMPIISASPGYELLGTFNEEEAGKLGVIRHPVLGWRVDPYGGVVPVTLDGENEGLDAVKYPNGCVVVPACATYDDEEAWLEDMQKEDLKMRACKVVG